MFSKIRSVKTVSCRLGALLLGLGLLIGLASQAHAQVTTSPDLNVNQGESAGGATLDACSTVTISSSTTPELEYLTEWSIDGTVVTYAASLTIPADLTLTPPSHTIGYRIPNSVSSTSGTLFAHASAPIVFDFTFANPSSLTECPPSEVVFTTQPDLDVMQDMGGPILDYGSRITASNSPIPTLSHEIRWVFDEGTANVLRPNGGISVTIPTDLEPGEHTVTYRIPFDLGIRYGSSGSGEVLFSNNEPRTFKFRTPLPDNEADPMYTFDPLVFSNQENGGLVLEPGNTITVTGPTRSDLLDQITWTIDGAEQPDGATLTIPADLAPGEYEVGVVVINTFSLHGNVIFDSTTETRTFKFTIAPPPPPPDITASVPTLTTTVGIAITPVTITSSGGAVASYSIDPVITTTPGLDFSTTTGTISGTPTAVAGAQIYTITATNITDTDTATVTITVNPPTPVITTSVSTLIATVGIAIEPVTITSTSGGTVASYSIAPMIGNGLAFDTDTGTISGTPTAVAGAQIYTITATNDAGTTTATVTITVNPPADGPAPDVGIPDVSSLALTPTAGSNEEFGEEGLTLLLGETQEITISGGVTPYRAVLSSGDSITLGEIVVGTDGTTRTLLITGTKVGLATLSIQDLRTDSVELAVEVYAPQVLDSGSDDGVVFRGGARVSNAADRTYFKERTFSVGNEVDIIFVITPRASDIGEQVNIVVAAVTDSIPNTIWLLTEGGLESDLVLYDGEMPVSVSYLQDITLTANTIINITPENPFTLTVGEAGNWEVFVGYQLANGELVYHVEPLKIEVTR